LGYAIGALAMTLAQSLTAIIIFWAIIGGIGASLLLPAMQSLIHGNFEGAAQRKLLVDQPKDVQAEIIRINTDARPIALQVALLIRIRAALAGLFISFRMVRQPDPVSTGAGEGMAFG